MLVAHDYNLDVNTDNLLDKPFQFARVLKKALQTPLPGAPAQNKMSPPHRVSEPGLGITPRTSAVLILLFPTSNGILLSFTKRLSTLEHHPGEICFPGGGVEDGDLTLTYTALRETSEELGVDAESVEILGRITPLYIAASQNLVNPIIGWLDKQPTYKPSPYEVDRVIEVPLAVLLDPRNVGEHHRIRHGQTRTAPCYRINADCIWGATAMILSEFLTIIRSMF